MSPKAYLITPIKATDYDAWKPLFQAYIEFYKSSLPDKQYRATFERLIDPGKDLHGIVVRVQEDQEKLVGIAHYYPHQDPWIEEKIMHLNDLFVDPRVRRRGLGKELILKVAADAEKEGCARLEWDTQHANPARKLYDQVGACDFVKYQRKLGSH